MNKKIIKVGIIGGLGPLASASFVETIYTSYLNNDIPKHYIHFPYVYLYSEPLQFQSSAVMSLSESGAELVMKLEKNIAHLIHQEIDCIIVCCFTAHALLPKLTPVYQAKIYSLVTQTLEYVHAKKTQFIVLSASTAREARVLETHPLWEKTSQQITLVNDKTQKRLDSFIQTVKNNKVSAEVLDDFLEFIHLFPGYQFIIACAELHILYKKLQTYSKVLLDVMYDPFFEIAQKIVGEK